MKGHTFCQPDPFRWPFGGAGVGMRGMSFAPLELMEEGRGQGGQRTTGSLPGAQCGVCG